MKRLTKNNQIKKYEVCFTGRKKDALGVTYPICTTVEAPSESLLELKLYDEYDHIRNITFKVIATAMCLVSLSACGVKLGSHIVVGTTSYLEEVNKGVHTENLKEHIGANDRARLQTKLDTEVN